MTLPLPSGPVPPDGDHLGPSLSAYLDGELAPAARRDAEAHLACCDECGAELEEVRYARSALRDLPVRAEPVALGPPAARPIGTRRMVWAGVAAAAALVAFLLPTEPEVAPDVPELVDTHATRASLSGDPLTLLAPVAVRFSP